MEKISFQVSPSQPNAELGFETWLDNQLIIDIDHLNRDHYVEIPVPDDEDNHVLKLVLKNKTFAHTQLTAQGNIASDAVIEIQNVNFDEIQLDQIFTEQAVYTHDFNGTGELSQHQFFGIMGCNGTVTLSFSTPVYIWLLEHM